MRKDTLPAQPFPSDEPVEDDAGLDSVKEISEEAYREAFGEDLQHSLDLSTWSSGDDLATSFDRLESEIALAEACEKDMHHRIREMFFPRIAAREGAPPGAGVFTGSKAALGQFHGLLLNGKVEACDGTRTTHDTLPLTIMQVGVSLVSYAGGQGTWGHRLFRRDLRRSGGDPVEELMALLEARDRRGGQNQPSRRDLMSDMYQRGFMAYAERGILCRRSTAPWRIGHGNPAPYELITGSGTAALMVEGTRVLRELIEGHQQFVFVASEPSDRLLLSLGGALRPLEYAVVDTLADVIERTVINSHFGMKPYGCDMHWDGEDLLQSAAPTKRWIDRFYERVAPQVVRGVYRASIWAPPQVFYAHVKHVHSAVHIALADSIMQEHRGSPLLIDLADSICKGVFGGDSLAGPVSAAYAAIGEPWRYASERMTRV